MSKERMNGAKVKYLNSLARKLHEVLGGSCYICRSELCKSEITKDHVFPKSFGYSIDANMMPAHFDCNNDKANRTPTIEEIELSILAYETLGMPFDPHLKKTVIDSKDYMTKHFMYYMNLLKEDNATN